MWKQMQSGQGSNTKEAERLPERNALVELIKILCCPIRIKASLKPKAELESRNAVVLQVVKDCSRSNKGSRLLSLRVSSGMPLSSRWLQG